MSTAHVRADDATASEPNYITQQLLIYNDQGQVLLQKNAWGWSFPGLRFDQRASIRTSLDGLAQKYGLRIRDVWLAGLFTYEYGDSSEVSTRSFYGAKTAGGVAVPPEGTEALEWVTPSEAVARIDSESQRSPPSFVQQTTRMLEQPATLWGGAFHVWKDGAIHRSRVLEPMYVLGRTTRP